MTRRLLVADLFCGAGGSSTGALRAIEALGRRMNLVAVNHNELAIETHSLNHPDAHHLCSDVYRLRPRDAVPSGRLDLLLASPTCTFFSRARGGQPISREQRYGRMTPTQVVRWCAELRPRLLVVENVPEFVDWGPVHREGWLAERGSPCARARCKEKNPCRRKRGYYYRPWVRKLEALGFRLEWRVLNAADYGDATTRQRYFMIGRRDGRPLEWPTPTHARDGAGDLFGAGALPWRPALEVIDWSIRGESIFARRKPLAAKTLARIYAGAVRFGWPVPIVERLRAHMVEVGAPVPDVLPRRLAPAPFVIPQGGGGEARLVSEPLATIGTRGAHALVVPYYGASGARPVERPLPTITTRDRFGLAFITASFGERPGQSPRVHPITEPVPTICATGRVNLVAPGDCDVLYRMFEPHELASATGLEGYAFAGNKTEVVKQIGNAVPRRTATALVAALVGGARAARVAS